MMPLFAGTLFVLALAYLGVLFALRLRVLQTAGTNPSPDILAGRYRPMLRLLSDDDFRFVSVNPSLIKTLRTQRCRLFRGYLHCLTRDYGSLLGGIRHAMVRSGIDRPDLAKALLRNRIFFTMAVCKVEIRVTLFAAGIGKVDISGLVAALDSLRAQAGAFQSMPAMAH